MEIGEISRVRLVQNNKGPFGSKQLGSIWDLT